MSFRVGRVSPMEATPCPSCGNESDLRHAGRSDRFTCGVATCRVHTFAPRAEDIEERDP